MLSFNSNPSLKEASFPWNSKLEFPGFNLRASLILCLVLKAPGILFGGWCDENLKLNKRMSFLVLLENSHLEGIVMGQAKPSSIYSWLVGKLQWIELRGPSVGKTQSANNCLTAQLCVVTTDVQCHWDSGQETGSSQLFK